MTTVLKTWWQKRKRKEHEDSIVNRRETIIFNLFDDMESEETIEMYKNVTEIFSNKIKKRLDRISFEKNHIEEFLKELNK